MRDYLPALERLADPGPDHGPRLHRHLTQLADEVEGAMNGPQTA